jgi:hypothetical protein
VFISSATDFRWSNSHDVFFASKREGGLVVAENIWAENVVAEKQGMRPLTTSEPTRYYRVQIRLWTRSDPSKMELGQIAEEIDRGNAFLTALEVMKVADNVNGIDDPDVRQSFENIAAAERILQNVSELPKQLRDRLHAALSNENKDARGGIAA